MLHKYTWLTLLAVGVTHLAWGEEALEREWVRIWPCESDATTITSGHGQRHAATGPGSATWFQYGGAGRSKTFTFIPGRLVMIKASGDSGRGACLGHVSFHAKGVSGRDSSADIEFRGPDWHGVAPAGEPTYRLICFTPTEEKYCISTLSGGFYIEIHQALDYHKAVELSENEAAPVRELIRELGAQSWQKRKAAHRQLQEMGRSIVALLEEEADNSDMEIRLSCREMLSRLKPEGAPISDELMRNRADALAHKLAQYIEMKSFDCTSEPVRSLAKIGPMAVNALKSHVKHENEFVRAAAIHALGRLSAADLIPAVMAALKNDPSEKVRLQAATALGCFTGNDSLNALKQASDKDPSEKVRAAAAQALSRR